MKIFLFARFSILKGSKTSYINRKAVLSVFEIDKFDEVILCDFAQN